MTDESLLAAIKASDTLKALADAGNDAAVADGIAATKTQPKAFTAADIYGVLQPTTVSKLLAWANLSLVMADIEKQSRVGLGVWAAALQAAGIMTADDVTALTGVLSATEQVPETIGHDQISRVLNAIRPVVDGSPRALPIKWQ